LCKHAPYRSLAKIRIITIMQMYFHKNIRLSSANYTGNRAYFVTQCCHDRSAYFQDAVNCEWFLGHLRSVSTACFFAVPAYCVMPDHVHLLVAGLAPNSDFLRFMKGLKIKTSREFASPAGLVLWQKKYYDHILRPKESMDPVAWYIWLNPVRAGLAADAGIYPFAGSFTGSMPASLSSTGDWAPPYALQRRPPRKAAATKA
jgi:putative transposase